MGVVCLFSLKFLLRSPLLFDIIYAMKNFSVSQKPQKSIASLSLGGKLLADRIIKI